MKSVLGLDVGSHQVKAVELRQTFRGLEGGQLRVQPRSDTEEELAESLHRFVRAHHLPDEHVVCAIPGDRISSRKLEFPFRDRKKLRAAVPFEIEGLVPFDVEDIVVDWDIADDTTRPVRVVASLARRNEVSRILDEFREAALEPRILEAEGLVLGNLATVFDLGGTQILADLGHAKSTFCLLIDGRAVAARTVPAGGRDITQAIAKDRRCTLEEAEQLKCSEGIFDADHGSTTPGAVAVLDRIARELIRFIESQQEFLNPERGGELMSAIDLLTVFGGSSKLLRLDDYLLNRVGVRVSHLAPPEDPKVAALISGGDPSLFAQAIALAIRATGQATTRMNFRQDEFAYKTDLRQYFTGDLRPTAILAGVVALLTCASLATSLILESNRARRLEAQATALYEEAFPSAPATSSPVPALSQQLREARDRADFLGIYGTNLSALDLLAELSRRIPADLKVQFEEITINRRVIKVKVLGESYQAADRIKELLAQSGPFVSAEVDKVKSTRRGRGKRFNLTISLGAET